VKKKDGAIVVWELRELSCGMFAGQEGPERGEAEEIPLLEAVTRKRLLKMTAGWKRLIVCSSNS
jgi:hypothetical protein